MHRPLLLVAMAFALGALAQDLDMVPDLHDVRQLLSIESEQVSTFESKPAPTPRAPRPQLHVVRIWDSDGYGYALVRLSNQGDAMLAGSRARVRCTAFDVDDRPLGSSSGPNRQPLGPGEEVDIEIPVALDGGTLESIQCGLDS